MNRYLWIKRYFAALNWYRWYAAGGFALMLAIAGTAAQLLPENKATYLAQTTLFYKQSGDQPATSHQTSNQTKNQSVPQDVVPGVDALLSEPILVQTADHLRVKRQQVTPDQLKTQIIISKDSNQANRLLIHYWGETAAAAELVVDAFVDTVNRQSVSAKRQQVDAALKLLETRKSLLGDKLRVAEEKLREFSRQEKPAIQAAVDGSLVSAITNIQQQQRQLQRDIEGVDAEMLSLQRQLGMTPDQAYLASALSADTTIAGLITKVDETKAQIEIQRRELQPKHPDIVALEHQRTVDENRLRQRVREIARISDGASLQNGENFRSLSNLDKARQELANKLVNLQTQRQRFAQELAILNRSEPQLRQNYRDGTELKLDLEKRTREVARYREALDQTEKQLAEIELKKAEARSDWINEGSVAVRKEFNWLLTRPGILLVGTGVGLLLAALVVLLADALHGKILLPEEVQAILRQQIPLLGILPTVPHPKDNLALSEAHSPYLDSYELLRSSLHRHSQSQPLKVVVLSSTRQDEGKTTSAYNLAIASARAGKKTLLIEANLRGRSQAHWLAMSGYQPEPSNQVAQYWQIENMQSVADVKNLFILPAPEGVERVSEVLESDHIQPLLKQAREEFDLIVIDTAALQFSDALLIEPHTDGLVLITRPGYTDRRSLKIIVEKLTEFSHIKLLGIAMNDVTASARYAHLLSL